MKSAVRQQRGHPQGVPLRGMAGWRAMGVVARTRAPTRDAPTGDGGLAGYGSRGAYEGTHKGCPYGGWRVGGLWESWRVRGHPQGVPLRGAGWRAMGVVARTRAPTRDAPTGDGGLAGYGSRGAYEGTHKGCPYGERVGGLWESWRVRGHPQGVPLRGRAGWRAMGVVARTRAPTRDAPTGDGGLAGYGSRGAYEGTHKGCPYGGWRVGGLWESWRVRGHPQGVPLRGMAGWKEVAVAASRFAVGRPDR